jgi:radical SAM superfamily enzyme YgiQ (UPF0313 family)
MHRRFGTTSFAFYDDALLFHKEDALVPFLERAVARAEHTSPASPSAQEFSSSDRRLSFFLPNAVHLRYMDLETAGLMRRAGFEEVRLGYETADDASPAAGDKYRRAEVPRAVESLIRAGFPRRRIVLYILAGLPGQKAAEVKKTIEKASRFGVRLSVAEYSPVPGTSLWKESAEESSYPIEREPLFHNNTIFPTEWEDFTLDEMQELKRMAREASP